MSEPQQSPPAGSLASRSFLGYLVMGFLTAVNDSMFRWLIVPIAKFQMSAGSDVSAAEQQASESLVLSLGLASFIVPSIVLAPWSGWLADRFSKKTTTVGLKVFEVVIMVVGVFMIRLGSLPGMFVVLFLTGAQSALLSTAKFGIIPELVPREKLSAANGLTGLVTLLAVIVGTIAGNLLYGQSEPGGQSGLWLSGLALTGVAVVGLLASLLISPVRPASPQLAFPWNPLVHSWRDIRLVLSDKPIFRVTLGIAFFWSLAALAQLNIDTFVINNLKLGQTSVGTFLAVLSIGVGAGSLLAGVWSAGRVELGMVPLGTVVMAAACVLAWFSSDSMLMFGLALALIGLGGGLFNVPLSAYLQDRSPHGSLGAILAAGNQITSVGILLVSILFPLLRTELELSADQIFLVAGLGTLPILLYSLWLLPQATIRFVVWLMSRFVYRVRTYGLENIPDRSPALLVANHVTWIDGILILLTSSRPIRMIAYADYVQGGVMGWLSNLFGIIPIKSSDGPKGLIRSLNTARDALNNGELVCIFAEGRITRTGELLKFEKGLLRILKGTTAPVLPVYLDELWGSIFSYEGGRFLWKKPRHWPYPVSISFGSLLPHHEVTDVDVVRNAVINLREESALRRKDRIMIPALRFVRHSRMNWSRVKVADSAGAELTGGRLLTGALAFHNLLTSRVLDADEKMVGLLVPPSAGGAVANLAIALSGRVSVNLNYTLSEDVVNFCIREAGIKRVLTSRKFMEKRPMNLEAEVVYLEDLREQIGIVAKLRAAATARLMPLQMLSRKLGLDGIGADDLMTVIFTSGSTGEPKGVMLSHGNINSNLNAANEVYKFDQQDVILGVLPFFHSFGFTVGMWLPFCIDPGVVYHFNPLDARMVARLIEKHKVTIIAATPTFLKSYMKRCSLEQMKTVDLALVGAEKMPPELRDAWKDKYGFEPTEAYGATELSPAAALNCPDNRSGCSGEQSLTRHGTVGKAIPHTEAAVFHPETSERLGTHQEGLLYIKGPNVMLGYLNRPDKTEEVLRDGWYNTGDIARIDDDGFIEITGRQSRFSKIGGEMVPHIRIEQELTRIMDDDLTDEPQVLCAVTAVPDTKKGERLIVLHKPVNKSIPDVLTELQQAGMPNIWIPSQDSFLEMEQVPLLGTGKLDLKAVKDTALDHFGPDN
ncbi:MAG: acyl-[ACP]--phospholipid O-acyltransferase [Planctomycetaceae bacterium]|nr:acyl-[ACP]--phospholipid O-acyltransferase [Planctomycetaceae bacterium]